MENQKALEWFAQRDKKSLMAGIVYGQGLKGRARVPQTPTDAPAGFPRNLWDAAQERAGAMIAAMQAEESGATQEPETPDNPQFDKEAFCFGVAAGRSLEGWEIDGATNFPGEYKLIFYLHIERTTTVSGELWIQADQLSYNGENIVPLKIYYLWGDGHVDEHVDNSNIDIFDKQVLYSHEYEAGDYVFALIFNYQMRGDFDFFHAENKEILRATYISEGSLDGIGDDLTHVFQNCAQLQHVTMEPGLSYIGYNAFKGCANLESIIIPEGVTEIQSWAFEECRRLAKITIPVSVTKIGGGVFYHCYSLSDVYYSGSEREWRAINIEGQTYWNAPLYDAVIHYNSTGPDDVHDE